mmetsp:Transcript_18789/g.42869  ORF Transcript_18789/g.42869 Transcript_18789/m.42869 type:complete len:235 (+) Transcript_18789:354-1058(+)
MVDQGDGAVYDEGVQGGLGRRLYGGMMMFEMLSVVFFVFMVSFPGPHFMKKEGHLEVEGVRVVSEASQVDVHLIGNFEGAHGGVAVVGGDQQGSGSVVVDEMVVLMVGEAEAGVLFFGQSFGQHHSVVKQLYAEVWIGLERAGVQNFERLQSDVGDGYVVGARVVGPGDGGEVNVVGIGGEGSVEDGDVNGHDEIGLVRLDVQISVEASGPVGRDYDGCDELFGFWLHGPICGG